MRWGCCGVWFDDMDRRRRRLQLMSSRSAGADLRRRNVGIGSSPTGGWCDGFRDGEEGVLLELLWVLRGLVELVVAIGEVDGHEEGHDLAGLEESVESEGEHGKEDDGGDVDHGKSDGPIVEALGHAQKVHEDARAHEGVAGNEGVEDEHDDVQKKHLRKEFSEPFAAFGLGVDEGVWLGVAGRQDQHEPETRHEHKCREACEVDENFDPRSRGGREIRPRDRAERPK
mmetsp:Transcript_1788/g.5328  ORF Transcript_1788/g.5328 Transcript_1788/m.5328 type:complete len:228 (+) Transcript_1788:381-1064(+)